MPPARLMILCSAPQRDMEGREIMQELEDLCDSRADLFFGYDWAGSSFAHPQDKDVVWSDPKSVEKSRWFGLWRAGVKKQIILLAQMGAPEVVLLAVEGGPVSDRESRELAKLKQEAQEDMKSKGLDVAVVIEDMEYLTFMKRYGSGGTVPPPTEETAEAWPKELLPLVTIPAVKEYMDSIELESLDDCHYLDESMRKPLEEAIATAPKIKQKQAKTLLTDLWTRAEIFQRWDEDESGALDYMEVDKAINATFSREMIGLLLGKKNLQDRFNAIDTNKDGVISFGEMYREVRRICAESFVRQSFRLTPRTVAAVREGPAVLGAAEE